MRKISIVLTLTLLTVIWFSCTKSSFVPSGFDCAEPVAYDTNIKPIIDRYCTDVGCHLGPAQGDYTTFQGMEPDFNGSIRDRVLNKPAGTAERMPPNYAREEIREMTPEDFMLINCWIEQGFPEN